MAPAQTITKGEAPMAVESAPIQVIRIQTGYSRIKRIFDITITLLLSPILLFVGAIAAVAIRLDSSGPIFYRQKRVGQNGEEFAMLKFRSMYTDSSDTLHRQAIEQYLNGELINGDDNEHPNKLINDPRITKIGKFIRKTSIDELPQFWNVLRGDMSLVGPRPPLTYEVEWYNARDWLRLSGKPGLTGPWQVNGRSIVSFQEMVEMDIRYLQNQSLWQDCKFIVLTIPVMIFARGGG
jgi:lipopolysaccharide/colanic/teichoic acid biosynthesis glycosyltransferase